MNIQHKIYHLGRLILSAFLLFAVAACGTKPQESAAHVTSTGFVCPEPSPRVEFESKEINGIEVANPFEQFPPARI